MSDRSVSARAGSIAGLALAAVGGGALAGAATAAFIWMFETLIDLVWSELPEALGVDPYGSWFLFAIPVVGGVLVGLGQIVLGNYPRPIDENVATWRAGGHVEPSTVPATATNSLVALIAGAPIGFEAALTGLIGGMATWIARNVGSAGAVVRRAWGAEQLDEDSPYLRAVPYWIAAVAGLAAYRWLPFGQMDLTFRFADRGARIALDEALVMFGFAVVVTIPVAWAAHVVARAEVATVFRRSPVVAGVLGGLVFAALAVGHEYVLFSGQQGIQHLGGVDTGALWYLAIAKWGALVVVLLAGWRGGPIFPMFTAVAALAVATDRWFDLDANLVMIAGIATVSVVLLRGNLPLAVVLSLYAVPLSFLGAILVGAVGALLALGVGRRWGVLPAADQNRSGTTETRRSGST